MAGKRSAGWFALPLVLLVIGLAAPAGASAAEGDEVQDPVVTVVVLVIEGCPFCARMEAFLADLADFVGPAMVVERVDVDADPEGRERWFGELRARGVEPGRVPAVVIDELTWIGVDDRIEQAIVDEVLARTAPQAPQASRTPAPVPVPEPAPGADEDSRLADAGGWSTRRIVLAAVVALGLGAVTIGVRSRTRAERPVTP